MGRRIKYGRGRVVVELEGDLLDKWTRRLEQIAPVTMESIDRNMRRILGGCAWSWPIKTGRSRKAFAYFTRIEPDGIRGVIENNARNPKDGRLYAYVIHSKLYGTPWKTLLVTPVEDAAVAVALEAADELARLMEGRR